MVEHHAVGFAESSLARAARAIRRREIMGYVVWGAMGVVIAIPEIWAAVGSGLPWQTISSSIGTGLARDHTWVSLIVILVLAVVGYFSFRFSPTTAEPARDPKVHERPFRRLQNGGRLTLSTKRPDTRDADLVGRIGILYALVSSGVIAGATILTDQLSSGDAERYHASYVLYGLIGVFWILGPSVVALAYGREAPWPTLFVTVKKLESRLGPLFGSLVAALIVGGLAILLLHLVLYPFPDITHILNPNSR